MGTGRLDLERMCLEGKVIEHQGPKIKKIIKQRRKYYYHGWDNNTASPILSPICCVCYHRKVGRLTGWLFWRPTSQSTPEGHATRQRQPQWTAETDVWVLDAMWTNNWKMQMRFLKSLGRYLTSLSISERGSRQRRISLNTGKKMVHLGLSLINAIYLPFSQESKVEYT